MKDGACFLVKDRKCMLKRNSYKQSALCSQVPSSVWTAYFLLEFEDILVAVD